MADITSIGAGFGSASSFGGFGFGVVQIQGVSEVTLVTQDSSHSNVSTSPAITQQHLLSVSSSAHSMSVDTLTLIESYLLSVQNSLHTVFSEPLFLSQEQILALESTIHSLLSSNVENIIDWTKLGVDFGVYLKDFDSSGAVIPTQADSGTYYRSMGSSGIITTADPPGSGAYTKEYKKIGRF